MKLVSEYGRMKMLHARVYIQSTCLLGANDLAKADDRRIR